MGVIFDMVGHANVLFGESLWLNTQGKLQILQNLIVLFFIFTFFSDMALHMFQN